MAANAHVFDDEDDDDEDEQLARALELSMRVEGSGPSQAELDEDDELSRAIEESLRSTPPSNIPAQHFEAPGEPRDETQQCDETHRESRADLARALELSRLESYPTTVTVPASRSELRMSSRSWMAERSKRRQASRIAEPDYSAAPTHMPSTTSGRTNSPIATTAVCTGVSAAVSLLAAVSERNATAV